MILSTSVVICAITAAGGESERSVRPSENGSGDDNGNSMPALRVSEISRSALIMISLVLVHCILSRWALVAAEEPRELFTLEVENAEDPGGPTVPLLVREGDNAEVLASLFAKRYQLDEGTRDALAMAIIEHAKSMGCVKPLFVLQANVSKTLVPINVYKGDAPRTTASLFAQRYNLSARAQQLVERSIAHRAKASGNYTPTALAIHSCPP